MKPFVGYYIGGLLHGAAVGLVVGWFLNSGYAFSGSTQAGVIFPACLIPIVIGHWINRRASRSATHEVSDQVRASPRAASASPDSA